MTLVIYSATSFSAFNYFLARGWYGIQIEEPHS